MNAGQKLDALVAEKVMGWKRIKYDPPIPGLRFRPQWFDADKETGRFWEGGGGDYYHPDEEWSPSTDITAAWEVLEWLKRDRTVHLWAVADGYTVQITGINAQELEVLAQADTAPLAICTAALSSVGVEVAFA